MKKYLKHSAKGFGLIEIMISVVILFTVLMIVPTVLMKHTQNTTSNRLANEVTSIGQGIINDMRKSAKAEPTSPGTDYPSYKQLVPNGWNTNGASQTANFTYHDMQGVKRTIQLKRKLTITDDQNNKVKHVELELSDTKTPQRFNKVTLRASIIEPGIKDNRINPGMNYIYGNIYDRDTMDPIDAQIYIYAYLGGGLSELFDSKNGYYQSPYYHKHAAFGKAMGLNIETQFIVYCMPKPIYSGGTTSYYYAHKTQESFTINQPNPVRYDIPLQKMKTGDLFIKINKKDTNTGIERALASFSYTDPVNNDIVYRSGYADAEGNIILYGMPEGQDFLITISSNVTGLNSWYNFGYYGDVITGIAVFEGQTAGVLPHYTGELYPIVKTCLGFFVQNENGDKIEQATVKLSHITRQTDSLGITDFYYPLGKEDSSYQINNWTLTVEAEGYQTHTERVTETLNPEGRKERTITLKPLIFGFALYPVKYNSTHRRWDILRDAANQPQVNFTVSNPSNRNFLLDYGAYLNSEMIKQWVIDPGWAAADISTHTFTIKNKAGTTNRLSEFGINDTSDIIESLTCYGRSEFDYTLPTTGIRGIHVYRYNFTFNQNASGQVSFNITGSSTVPNTGYQSASRNAVLDVTQPVWDPDAEDDFVVTLSMSPDGSVRELNDCRFSATVSYKGQVLTTDANVSYTFWWDIPSRPAAPLDEIALMSYSSKAVRTFYVYDTNHITTDVTAKAYVTATLNGSLTKTVEKEFIIEPFNSDANIRVDDLPVLQVAPDQWLEITYTVYSGETQIMRQGWKDSNTSVQWSIVDDNDIANGHYFQLATSCPTKFKASNSTPDGDNEVRVHLLVTHGSNQALFEYDIIISGGGIVGR